MTIAPPPPLRPWVPPPVTQEDLPWANLRTIDLSKFDSPDPAERDAMYDEFKAAIKEDGFLYLTNFGMTEEQCLRQFAFAQHCFQDGNMSDEEKERLTWEYTTTGKYTGYKPKGVWDVAKGVKDNFESFNWYSDAFTGKDRIPQCLVPYLDEITSFNEYLHDTVNRKLLTLLSRMLELPDDYLWDYAQAHNGVIGEGYFRQMVFHPKTPEQMKIANNVQMHGHQDYGITTLLLSQPIAALQVLTKEKEWRYVKYKPGGLIVNLGEVTEFISGGHLQATRHRVTACPADQSEYYRITIGLFVAAKNELPLTPLTNSPYLQREGYVNRFQAGSEGVDDTQIPSAEEWRLARVVRSMALPVEVVEIEGTKYNKQLFKGIYVLEPI